MKKYPMTILGEKLLREELDHLKGVMRPKIIAAIAEAREHGDLKENAEYHAAKEQQSFLEGRVLELEGKLSSAQVIDVTLMENNGRVIFGATVELIDTDNDEAVVYQIVGEDEADIKELKISVSSPIARALVGKEEGEEVTVNTPSGERVFIIDVVKYI